MGDSLDYLDNVHTVFGEVAEGMDVLMKINEAYCDKEHRPYKDIRYTSPEIIGPVQQTCEHKIKIKVLSISLELYIGYPKELIEYP